MATPQPSPPPLSSARHTLRWDRLAWLALAALVILFFWKLASSNLILARGDLFLYFYPYWDYRAQALLDGRLPLWNPLLFMGAPFLANSQAGVYYPFNWPLAVFGAPTAVKIAMLSHLALAATGCFAFGRRALGQSVPAAFLAGALFALGGYLSSQVEHINQLQALAWLPWLLLAAHRHLSGPPERGLWPTRRLLAMAAIVALQLLAGHTQSVFISLAGAAVYGLTLVVARRMQANRSTPAGQRRSPRALAPALAGALASFAAVSLMAAALAAAQLLPTLELSGQSLRGGGLSPREALSFSLDPRLLGRALLPSYSHPLFSEYAAHLGVAGLAMAALGLAGIRKSPVRLGLLALAVVGLAFALGAFNPLYGLLSLLPPFNLFRVPARWLALFALGTALLAGHGLDALAQRPAKRWLALLAPGALMLAAPLAAGLTPAGDTGPLGWPASVDLVGWLLPLALFAGLLAAPLAAPHKAQLALMLAVVELFAASRGLPYNDPTAPEAYTSVRPAMTQLLATRDDDQPPARFLSMSTLLFDPGDLAEMHSYLDGQLPASAAADYITAAKHKEVLSPNLPLAWNIAAVDGFDGGVLPLAHYAAFSQLFTGALSSDGRLRENMLAAPEARLLSLTGARWLITDKLGDAWIEDVFYDLQFTLRLAQGEWAQVGRVPPLQSTALGMVPAQAGGHVVIGFEDGSVLEQALSGTRVRFDAPGRPVSITLHGPLDLNGLSLIDERTGAFQPLTLGDYRLAHSGDVKVYENLVFLPRALVVPQAVNAPDYAAARGLLADPNFDPAMVVVLAGSDGTVAGDQARSARVEVYEAERVLITAEGPGNLLLADAYYPGWTARLNGTVVPILRANIMFRAVELPPGLHSVEFRFEPRSVRAGLWVSGLSLAAWIALWLAAARRRAAAR